MMGTKSHGDLQVFLRLGSLLLLLLRESLVEQKIRTQKKCNFFCLNAYRKSVEGCCFD
ncbi:hypothetical protein YC2023_012531 [Brassica napus]